MKVRDVSDLKDDRAIQESLQRLPNCLYRYWGVRGERLEWIRKLIVDSELYFEQPGNFNDPLDCRIPPSFTASRDVKQKYWNRVAMEHHQDTDRRTRRKIVAGLIRDSVTSNGRQKLEEGVFQSVNKNGIVCFSKDASSMLLWSYYAEGHRGIAIRFDTSLARLSTFREQVIPIEIRYENKLPETNFYHSTTNEFLTAILGTKAKAWEHEKEWRLLCVGHTGYLHSPLDLVNGIIFGIRIDAAVEAQIRTWVRTCASEIELLRVRHRRGSFELELVDA